MIARGLPQIQQTLKEGQQMGDRTMNRVQSPTTAPDSKDSTIDIPHVLCPCTGHGVAHPAPIVGEARASFCSGQSKSCSRPGMEYLAPQLGEEGRHIRDPEQSLQSRGNQVLAYRSLWPSCRILSSVWKIRAKWGKA
ncbi:hypothetical protein ATANTOWER_010215 [Ataeniobius toweri]|uniref:Uncharacterized protein n=1 Tax=Ataeniobius toweri TaxID=208326 RepID=A0ABU7AQP0_9TELE|nr:hypothetical protein [Ataeniobius toweri]